MKKKILPLLTALFTFCISACNQTASSETPKSSEAPSSVVSSSSVNSGESKTSSSSNKVTSSSNVTSSNSAKSSVISSSTTSSSSRPTSSSTPTSSSSTQSSSSTPASSSSTSSSSDRPKNVTLDIFAFNDNHGCVKDTQGKGIGIAKLTTFVKQKTANKNAVLISQGDMWQGSVESNYTKGNLMTEWMNQLGFVSMTVGNHEYDWGKDYIIQNQELANFPTLGINVLNKSNSQRVDYLSPSITFEKAGAKIGVIGAIGNCISSISSSKVKDVYFATGSALTTLVKNEATRLRNTEKCDFIIYSIHGDAKNDDQDYYDTSLSTDNYVDLVLEGHTHKAYAYQDEGGVYHVQNSGYNESVYDIAINLDLATSSYTVSPTFYDTSYYSSYRNLDEDVTTLNIINKYYDKFSFAYEELGVIDGFKDPNTIRNKVADLYLEVGTQRWASQYNLILGGGYMSCRGNGLQAGTVRYSDISNLLPFDNEIVLCSIRGSDLANTQFITGADTYFVTWSDYGNTMKNNINYSSTYYLITDTYSSDYSYNHLTVVDTYDVGVYARDLLAIFIQNGGWAYIPPVSDHAGTIDDPKTIAEAIDYARHHEGQSASAAGSEGFFYKGVVTRQAAQLSALSGDLNAVYVADALGQEDMQIYYLKRNQYRNPTWTSVDDLQIGDAIVFYGQAFNYNSRILEFASGSYCVSINGVSTD